MDPLNTMDRKILGLLPANSRITMAELAATRSPVGHSLPSAGETARRARVIRRWSQPVDQKSSGWGVGVRLRIGLTAEGAINRFQSDLEMGQDPRFYLMTEIHDYLLRVVRHRPVILRRS